MGKECWQLKLLDKDRTTCFKMAGSKPCKESNCLVIKELQRLKPDCEITQAWFNVILPRYTCRMSALSADNAEFVERMGGSSVTL